ncbi:hypothetical protein ACIQWA_13095 [Kitasatospora sp. NPDC098652]|uniref:hypothetical protein n=1 Tax=Kitasatospora sp. NPDC098652 TaxID=3364095 RepID=UPI0037F97AA8
MGVTGKLRKDDAAVYCALALAAHYFPGPLDEHGQPAATFRHAAFLLSGQYDKWDGWARLPHADKQRLADVLVNAPGELAGAPAFGKAARRILAATAAGQAPQFVLVGEPHTAVAASPRIGDDFLGYVDRTMKRVHKDHPRPKPPQPAAAGQWLTRTLYAGGIGEIQGRAAIPVLAGGTEADPCQTPPQVHTAAHVPNIEIPTSGLLDLARQLDLRLKPDGRHLHQVLKALFGQLNSTDMLSPKEAIRLCAGATEVFNAPTGTGKSVLVRVMASWFAINGLALAIVLPTVEATLSAAWEISQDLAYLGREETCTPLMSPYGLHDRAMKIVSRIDGSIAEQSAKVLWKIGQLSYGCSLSRFTEATHPYPAGSESCMSLYPLPPSKGTRRCPFVPVCGKYQQHYNACTASVVVTNHHNFMMGRMPIGVTLDDRPVAGLTVAEFLFRRCHATLVDEIDQFQSTAIGKCSSELVLDSRLDKKLPLQQLHDELRKQPPATVKELVPPVTYARYLTEFLLAAVCEGQLHLRHYEGDGGPVGDRAGMNSTGWHISGGRDRRLIHLLFPEAGITIEHEIPQELFDKLNALRPPKPGQDPLTDPLAAVELEGHYVEARAILGELLGHRGADLLTHAQHRLNDLLKDVVKDEHDRAEAVELLIVRTWLSELDDTLNDLTGKTAQLRASGLASARALAERLERGIGANILPFGMLGRALFGYRVTGLDDPAKTGELTSQSITGDPHTYTAQLGSIVALALAGTERPVMGLSATAYFPQAVREHIHSTVKWWMTDAAPDSIRAKKHTITDALNDPIQISGLPQHLKAGALKELGERLYDTRIHPELQRLEKQDKDRAHAAVVVNSYLHCRYIALGIYNSGNYTGGLCVAVPPDKERRSDLPPLPGGIIELTPEEFETFPTKGKILVVPMARIARGLNIVIGTKSAITPVYLCTRPLALLSDPPEMYASVNAAGLNSLPKEPSDDPVAALTAARTEAWRRLSLIMRSAPGFGSTHKVLQEEIVAGMVVDMIQLAGRARRGGTDMTLHLVDYAFHRDSWQADLATILTRMHTNWDEDERRRMDDIYREALAAFLAYAGIEPAA